MMHTWEDVIYTVNIATYIRRPRLQQGERVRGEITSSKEQEARSEEYKQYKQLGTLGRRQRFWRLDGCNLELVSCRFRRLRDMVFRCGETKVLEKATLGKYAGYGSYRRDWEFGRSKHN